MNVLSIIKIKTKKGFSIGEVILAMFLLAVGIVAIMNLISSTLGYSLETRDRVIAAELAQEGVELVRNVRDHDFAQGGDGFSGFSVHKHCYRDYNDTQTSLDCDPNTGSSARYRLQYRNGYYEHYNPNDSQEFSRYLYVDYNPGQKTALVRSFVSWNRASFLPNNGNPSGCTTANSCIFTELYLTSWR